MRRSRGSISRLLSGGAWMLSARLGSGVAGLAASAILTRTIFPSEIGTYFLAVSIVNAGSILVSLGAKDAVVRCIAKTISRQNTAEARAYIMAALRLGALGASLSAVAYLLLAPLLSTYGLRDQRLASASGVIAVWIAFSGLQSLVADIFRGLQKYGLAACFNGIPGLATGSCFALSLLGMRWAGVDPNFYNVAVLNLLAVLATTALAGFWLHGQTRNLARTWSGDSSTSQLFTISWPMLASNLFLYILSQADLWCVGHFLAREQVALYGAAWRLAQLVALPIALANAVLPPLIAELHAQGNRPQLEELLRGSATLGGIPALLACLLMLAAGGRILAALYGTFYGAATLPLVLLSLGSVTNVLAGSSGFTLLMTGHERALMKITFCVGLVFIAGEWTAVPRFGTAGAAFVAASAMGLQNLFMGLWTKRQLKVRTYAYLFPARVFLSWPERQVTGR